MNREGTLVSGAAGATQHAGAVPLAADGASAPPARAGRRRRPNRVLRQLARNRAALAGLGFLCLLLVVALFAPLLAPHDPASQSLSDRLARPSWDHLLGTDTFGRDVLSRLIYATRVTVVAIVQALSLSAVLGIPLGLLAGAMPGPVDAVLNRVSDALLSLPSLMLALAIVGILGPGLTNAMLALGIVLAPPLFRLARGSARAVSSESYMEACRAVGCTPWRLLWRHVLPNASSPVLVQLSFSAGVIIIAEASLSFLGLGIQPPDASWGSMLRDAFDNMNSSPWFLLAPASMIALTVLSFSVLGDGLRDALEGRGTGDRSGR